MQEPPPVLGGVSVLLLAKRHLIFAPPGHRRWVYIRHRLNIPRRLNISRADSQVEHPGAAKAWT